TTKSEETAAKAKKNRRSRRKRISRQAEPWNIHGCNIKYQQYCLVWPRSFDI
ncbi:unnamed protein product, partial [Heterotrigona itama]